MKTLSTLTFALLMTTGALFAGESVDVTIRADSDALIEIENLSGSVKVTGWDQNEVKVTGTLGDDTEGLSTSGEGSHIVIEVEIPEDLTGVDGVTTSPLWRSGYQQTAVWTWRRSAPVSRSLT